MLKIASPKKYTKRDLNIIHLASLISPEVERGVAFEQAQEIVDIYAERGELRYANSLVALFNAAMASRQSTGNHYVLDKCLGASQRIIMSYFSSCFSLDNITKGDIEEATGLSRSTVERALPELIEQGYILAERFSAGPGVGFKITILK
ncbi:hypothetical protein NNU63_004792 [Klebsiella pneumoniae]|nr:hypothetical protein [Klebsiella pneumoniae]HBR3429049.1 hypothetical protein [Klebsiella pneumoniae]HBV4574965.1 hypothetical protein [Klebsiella pneumoniae]